MISEEELQAALEEYHRGHGERLGEHLQGIARTVIASFGISGSDRDDWTQEAVLACLLGVDDYDPNRTKIFSHFYNLAKWTILEQLTAAKRVRNRLSKYQMFVEHPGLGAPCDRPSASQTQATEKSYNVAKVCQAAGVSRIVLDRLIRTQDPRLPPYQVVGKGGWTWSQEDLDRVVELLVVAKAEGLAVRGNRRRR